MPFSHAQCEKSTVLIFSEKSSAVDLSPMAYDDAALQVIHRIFADEGTFITYMYTVYLIIQK